MFNFFSKIKVGVQAKGNLEKIKKMDIKLKL